MSEENVQIVRDAYDAFNGGDIPAVLATLDADVEWIEPGGGNAPSGTFRGPESVGQDVFAAVPENFDEFSAEAEDFRDEGDRVVVTGRFKGRAKSGADSTRASSTSTSCARAR
jgi:uncharacterized protein